MSSPPRATYRLQFHCGFTFADAAVLVDYLDALGISHIYASPILKARPGSMHGYDIVDHETLNPEIGDEAALTALSETLAARGMGLILDIVPNHMGVAGSDNAWWRDVLEWGESSPYADYFDIDWDAPRSDLRGKVLLPLLGDQYGNVLERGELALHYDLAQGGFAIWYFDHCLPVSPRSYAGLLRRAAQNEALTALTHSFAMLKTGRSQRSRRIAHDDGVRLKMALAELAGRVPAVAAALEDAAAAVMGRAGEPETWHRLHQLLERQSFRLAYWRTAADDINYRRFFNINELAGIRVELPELFARAHHRVLALVAQGHVQGLRIDHIDGLFDPRDYCVRLQREASAAAQLPEGAFYIVVEKILAAHEGMRDWPIAGTTGYDFIGQVGGLFVDPAGEAALTQTYAQFTGRQASFDQVLYDGKKRITAVNLASEMNVLARAFHALAICDWRTRDFTLNGMRAALDEVIASFPVYRTYVVPAGASDEDRRFIDWAIGQAKRRWPGVDTSILDFIASVLTGDLVASGGSYRRAEVLRLAMKFQQVSGPVMAKGDEDTAFYRYARLIALNEVGGDPGRFGVSAAAFHRQCEMRAKRGLDSMLAGSTHDTKRGEDARARLMLLSELPALWEEHVKRWDQANRLRRGEVDGEPAPDRNDEYIFYQTVIGSWPPDLELDDVDGVAEFCQRVQRTMVKVVREAKERSSWSNANAPYEAVLARYIQGALDASRPNPFLTDVRAFVEILARPGAINSLAQTLLRLTVPGVPDFYQGSELWNFDMVDPDNRRPVDYALRRRLLDELQGRAVDGALDRQGFAEMAAHWRDGREKLFLSQRVLALRRQRAELFSRGAYVPLETSGRHAEHLLAFARVLDGVAAVTVVPRLIAGMGLNGARQDWADTAVTLPEASSWRDVVAGRDWDFAAPAVLAAKLFEDFPVALGLSGGAGPV